MVKKVDYFKNFFFKFFLIGPQANRYQHEVSNLLLNVFKNELARLYASTGRI